MIDATRRGFLQLTGLGLATLALGCRSEESEAPPDAGKASPTKPRVDEAPVINVELRPFRLDFRSAGGHVMASEGILPIHQWMSWLRVRADQRLAELVLTRHSGDLVDRPVGRFRHALDDAALLDLQQAIESTKWAELAEPLIGDPTANLLTLDYVAGELAIHREFSASAQAFITAIWPLMEKLNAAMSAPLDQPIAALTVVAETKRGKGSAITLGLRLRNVGSEPIVITDPRVPPTSADSGPRAQLLVAQAVTGYSMPSWTAIALPKLPAGMPDVHVLEAGGELVIDMPWTPTLSGACLLQAVWQDYAGPVRIVPDQLSFIPLPEVGPASPPGPYPVRGAAFSSYASFDA